MGGLRLRAVSLEAGAVASGGHRRMTWIILHRATRIPRPVLLVANHLSA